MSTLTAAGVIEYCTFEVGPLFLGVDVSCVQEVLRSQEITSVPLAPPAVRGLINLRGQIVTALDLRCRLGLQPSGEPPLNVVVRIDDRSVSLLVDAIGDVIATDVTPDPAPQTASGVVLDACSGVIQLKERLMLVLDARRVTELGAMTRVLVVDDSRAMRLRMRQMLAGYGFEVLEAEDGTDALEFVEGCLISDLPRAALVDWNMPVMTGIDLVRHLRADTRFDDVRLLMVTSESEIERVHEALSAGVDEYLMKPFTQDQLAEKLEMLELAGGNGIS